MTSVKTVPCAVFLSSGVNKRDGDGGGRDIADLSRGALKRRRTGAPGSLSDEDSLALLMGARFDNAGAAPDAFTRNRFGNAWARTQRTAAGAIIPVGVPLRAAFGGGAGAGAGATFDDDDDDTAADGAGSRTKHPSRMTLREIVDHLEECGEIPRREFMKGAKKHAFYAAVSGFAISGLKLEDPESKKASFSWVRAPFAAGTPGHPLHKADGVIAHVADLADPLPLGAAKRGVKKAVGAVGNDTDGLHSEDKRDIKPRQMMWASAIETVEGTLEALKQELAEQRAGLVEARREVAEARANLVALREAVPKVNAKVAAGARKLKKAADAVQAAEAVIARKETIIKDENLGLGKLRRSLEESKRTARRPRERTAAYERDVAQSRLELASTGAVPGGVGVGDDGGGKVRVQSPWMKIHEVIYSQILNAMSFINKTIIPSRNGVYNHSADSLYGLMTDRELAVPFTNMVRAYITVARDGAGQLTRWARDTATRAKARVSAEIAMEFAIFGGALDPWMF